MRFALVTCRVQNFVLPCINDSIFDGEEFVVHKSCTSCVLCGDGLLCLTRARCGCGAVEVLTVMAELELLDRPAIVDMAQRVGPLLCHPR